MGKRDDILGEILSDIFDTDKEGNATISERIIKTEIFFDEDGEDDLDELYLLDEIDEFDDIDDAEKLDDFDEVDDNFDF